MSPALHPTQKTARIALIGLDEPSAEVLAEAFQQFGITSILFRREDAERMYTEKFDGCVLYLDDTAERVLQIVRGAPSNFRMVVYGLVTTTAQAFRFSRYGINAIIDVPINKKDVQRAIRATHLLVVHEFRRYVRLPLITTAQVHAEGKTLAAMGDEISTGGMSLMVEGNLPIGLPVELEFTLPNAAPLRVGATVRWAKGDQIGVRFDETHPSRNRVSQWIDDYLGI
jgi:hypothetical protein